MAVLLHARQAQRGGNGIVPAALPMAKRPQLGPV
jgi:hypothetical protein